MQRIFYGICVFYLIFFAFLSKLLMPLQSIIQTIGLGAQFLIMIGLLVGLNRLFKKYSGVFALLKNKIISDMLQVYAFIWLLISIVLINDLPRNLFELAP